MALPDLTAWHLRAPVRILLLLWTLALHIVPSPLSPTLKSH